MSKLRDSIYETFSAGPVNAVFVMDEQTLLQDLMQTLRTKW